jgi:hypothetical protein
MSTLGEKLNLRPQEKRLLAFIGTVLFVMFQVWFVFPRFKDWRTAQNKAEELRRRMNMYKAEIGRIPEYEAKLRSIQPDDAPEIPKGDQTVDFRRRVESMAQSGNISVTGMNGPNRSGVTATNQFFEEWSLSLQGFAGEKDWVDFLFKLSAGASTIRVRDLNLTQGPNYTNLNANLVLIANYQKGTDTPAPRKP